MKIVQRNLKKKKKEKKEIFFDDNWRDILLDGERSVCRIDGRGRTTGSRHKKELGCHSFALAAQRAFVSYR